MPDFSQLLQSDRTEFFDGAMGTLLQARGMGPGISPEEFGMDHPEAVASVHQAYREAGASVVTTNTFGGTRYKLGTELDAQAVNYEMARTARHAVGDGACVSGSVGPTGKFLRPMGDISFSELVAAFKEQIQGLVRGGVDLIMAETHFDLAEARAVVFAAREVCDLPVGVSMTFEKGVSLTGTPPEVFIDTLQNMGVDLLATNCSSGPEEMFEVVRAMMPRVSIPVLVMPNAGLPELRDGETVFPLTPETYVQAVEPFLALGVKFIGGCCGTGPDHIRALKECYGSASWSLPRPAEPPCVVLSSRTQSVPLYSGRTGACAAVLVGDAFSCIERQAHLPDFVSGNYAPVQQCMQQQVSAGAGVLRLGVDSLQQQLPELLPELVQFLSSRIRVPLCLQSGNMAVVDKALEHYCGSALLDFVQPGNKAFDMEGMEACAQVSKKYGSVCVVRLSGGGQAPETALQALAQIQALVEQAQGAGLAPHLLLVEVPVFAMSSQAQGAAQCLEVLDKCQQWGLATMLEFSESSRRLSAREAVETGFAAMAVEKGVSCFFAAADELLVKIVHSRADIAMG